MPGPVPKPPALRARRNRAVTRATLPTAAEASENKVPKLPDRESKAERWHPMVTAWWASVWKSPMATEFLAADMTGGLFNLAELYQKRWTTKDTKELIGIIAEIRQQEVRFGLSPIDRRRLQWEVEKGEQATERVEKRRKAKDADKLRAGKDPREYMKAVS